MRGLIPIIKYSSLFCKRHNIMEKRMQKIIFTIAISALFITCTSYDSNKVNTNLIQGKWQLVDTENQNNILDTVRIDYSKEITYLTFNGTTCTQHMPDLADTLNFTFSIYDYKLMLYKDNVLVNKLDIDSLNSDKLVLSQEKSEHIYKKIRQ